MYVSDCKLGIVLITLKLGKIRVLEEALSRALHVKEEAVLNEIEVHSFSFEEVTTRNEDESF